MTKTNIYTVGGAVQAGGGLYIQRQADNDLLKLCREGAFAYVLTSRQVGKSSLMVRTAEKLAEEGIRSVIVDLTVFGVQITAEAWYLGLLTAISDRLNLSTDVVEWWRSRVKFGDTQRLTEFFHNVLLSEVKERVVIFIDEIDSTLSLPAVNGRPFTDDFYAAIRYLYNARATEPDFRRLAFVLIGVATPSDLIRDPKRTPFNIGSRVDITDFTFEEALPLADGLELPTDEARQVLRWVLKWTGGHPYLTQRLCRVIAEQYRSNWTEAEVDRTVANTFLGKMSEHDNNLQFVRDMLTKRAPDQDRLGVLSTYKEIRLGRGPVRDEEQSPIKSHLKLSGVVKREDGKLHVRNPIYREVFDRGWIQEHWPVSWWKTIPKAVKIAASFIVMLLLSSVVLLALYAREQTKAANNEKLLAQEQKARRQEADSLLKKVSEALEEAQAQRKEATTARAKSDSLAIEKDKSSAYAKEQQKLAEQQAELAKKNADDAKKSTAEAIAANEKLQKSLSVEERRRRIDIARTLMRESTVQQQYGNTDLGILLARQAYLFNTDYGGPWNRTIYDALLKTLNGEGGPYPLRGHTATVRCVAFDAAGETLASASDDKTIRLWKRQQNFANSIVLGDHTQSVRALAFSPDNQTLASGSDDHTIRLWNIRQPKSDLKILTGHRSGVWAVAFSADGKTLASGGADSTVRLWDMKKIDTGAVLTHKHKARVRAVAFSANGQWLIAAGEDGTIQLLQIDDQRILKALEVKHASGIKSLAFKPERGLLASGGADGKVRLWQWNDDGELPKVQKEFIAHEAAINALSFSSDGRRLATASADKRVKIWDIEQTTEPALVFEHDAYVWSAAFSPDGNTLVSGSANNLIQIWITRTDILAEKACQVVTRNLSEKEWRQFVGADIAYDATCDKLQSEKTKMTKGANDEHK